MRKAIRPGRPRGARATPAESATAILDVAEQLVQTRGYNGFSYANIAVELGVTKASLHCHFASKALLGSALIDRYHAAFVAALAEIDAAGARPAERLERYVRLYDQVIRNGRMCLCGMLAAEHATLPAPMRTRLRRFFEVNERWLATVLEAGRDAGDFALGERPGERAAVVLGALEGTMLVARSFDDPRRFRIAARRVIADVVSVGSPRARH